MKDNTFWSRIPSGIETELDVEKILNQYKYQGREDWKFKDRLIKFDDEEAPVEWGHAVQIIMELLNPSPALTTLPGAEKFYEFLSQHAKGEIITVSHPIVSDTSYDMDFGKMYTIFVGKKKIGVYVTFGPKPNEHEYERSYEGILPGDIPTKPEKIALAWGNEPSLFDDFDAGKKVQTEWKRQDGWDEIPFP